MGGTAKITLVSTVLNEAGTIDDLLASIDAQTRRPEEIVIVDGGSDDGTLERVRAWAAERPGVSVLTSPGVNISRGRNLGIAAAASDLIAITDAGVVLDPEWFRHVAAALEDPAVDVVMGYYRPLPTSTFERLLSCLNLPEPDEVKPGKLMPTSRLFGFRREVFEAAGCYPDWLPWGEDMYVYLKMLEGGAQRAFVPEAVSHWRMRSSLKSFLRQYYRYSWGDGRAGMYPRRHLARFGAYGAAALLLAASRRHPAAALVPLGAGAAWLRPAFSRAARRAPESMPLAAGALPLLQAGMDAAKMAGYLAGRMERWRRS